LRSGYDLSSDEWIVPPEEDRAIDVKKEMNAAYVYALECADKMERLLRYEPSKAIQFWHQIHKRRRRDQQAGKGDFSNANIVYKFLDNRGLMPAISEVSGEYIASTKTAMEVDSAGLDSIVEQAFQAAPGGGITIRIDGVRPTEGYAFSPFKGSEEIVPIEELKPEHISQFLTTNQASWDDPQNYLGLWLNEKNNNLYIDVTQVKPDFDEAYRLAWNNDQESLWDITNSEEIPVRDGGLPPKETSVGRVASPMMHRQVRKWVYDAGQNKLLIGEMGPEEGSLPSHHQLAQQIGLDFITGSYHLGTINKNGWVSTEGGGGKTDNRSRYNAQQALLREASDSIQGFLGGQIELGGSDDKAPEPTWEF
jgi:DNA-binding transcriptional regulator YhcF (GntR family)